MSDGTEDILRQLRAGEDSAWEFKQIVFTGHRPIRPSRDDWADEIAAFANARGGVLLCGATDDGEAQGMSREQIVALDALLVEVSTDSIKPAVRIHTWHTWPGTCGSQPARSRPAWTCRNTATARCSRGCQRGGASRLFDARQLDPPVDVRRPPGDPVPRIAAEQPDGGQHGYPAGPPATRR